MSKTSSRQREMKTTEQKRAQAQRIVNLIDTRGDWVNRLYLRPIRLRSLDRAAH